MAEQEMSNTEATKETTQKCSDFSDSKPVADEAKTAANCLKARIDQKVTVIFNKLKKKILSV